MLGAKAWEKFMARWVKLTSATGEKRQCARAAAESGGFEIEKHDALCPRRIRPGGGGVKQ